MKKVAMIGLLAGCLLAACNTGTPPTDDTINVPVVADDFSVVAEGRLQPIRFANLSFDTGGQVAAVLVDEGQSINEGDVLARLESSEALAAQVAQAEAEALNARQAITKLNEAAALAKAQAESDAANARKSLDDAERKLRNLNYPDVDWYQEQIEKAQDALTTASENAQLLDIGSLQLALQNARDAEKNLRERLEKVKAAVADCKTCDPKGQFTVDGFPQTLADAQDDYNGILNRITEIELQIAQTQRTNDQAIKDAAERLEDAQNDLAFALSGPKPLDLELAEASVSLWRATLLDAQQRLAKLQNGPDPDQLAAAEARLAAANASLAAAQDALKNSELRAPFAGVVADVRVKVGEQAAPGQLAVVLADFSAWVIETDNLTEIEVVRVSPGQDVNVVLDALPEVTLHGVVTAISPVFEEKRGDITYAVTVTLTDANEKMRWGMTAVTTFER